MYRELQLKLKVPGQHNLRNAYAAIAVARTLKIPDKISVKALNNFKGTWRRFEYKGIINGAKIFDDYAHHPTEIKATLKAARTLLPERSAVGAESKAIVDPSTRFARSGNKYGRLWVVFQPHQYQRIYKLFEQFVNAFKQADKIVLLPIYSVAGREKESIKRKINSKKLAEAIKTRNQELRIRNQEVTYFNSFKKAAIYLRKNLKRGDIAIIMGAGDVYQLTELLFETK